MKPRLQHPRVQLPLHKQVQLLQTLRPGLLRQLQWQHAAAACIKLLLLLLAATMAPAAEAATEKPSRLGAPLNRYGCSEKAAVMMAVVAGGDALQR